jgi:subtilisin family serine protease
VVIHLKQKTGLIILAAMIFAVQSLCVPVFADENKLLEQTNKTVDSAFDGYNGNEILVMYKDGSVKTEGFSSKNEMQAEIKKLSNDKNVDIIQPNYSYKDTAVSVDDKLYPKQWALYNDGTFKIESKKNDYPVYNDPFGVPSMPGEWRTHPDDDFVMPWSSESSASDITSVKGIDINAQKAWNEYTDGKQVVIAVIDTGVNYNHEDLGSNILWTNSDEKADGIDDDNNGYIDDVHGWNFYDNNNEIDTGTDDSHGTHCAGTIMADSNNSIGIAGIASNADVKIMPLKALGGKDGTGTTESVIKAIKYAESNGATICNLSLGSSYDDKALYKTIAESNMLFVIAAGNGNDNSGYGVNNDKRPTFPASYALDNIISVADIQPDGTLNSTSNYGFVSVDLAAPGTYILSTTPDDSYSYMTGTSMAAPMVSAVCAMASSKYENATLKDVKNIVLNSVQKLSGLNGKVLTGGMLDAGAALDYDTSTLSHDEWTKPDNLSDYEDDSTSESYIGKGPKINFSVLDTILYLNVNDDDYKVDSVRYSSGMHNASDFANGTRGNKVNLDSNGDASFNILQGGTYTFYAIDSGGYETVSVINLSLNNNNGDDFFDGGSFGFYSGY